MSASDENEHRPATIQEQADLLDFLLHRCTRNGVPVDFASICLDKWQIVEMLAICTRLKKMAPHEPAIRQIVMGR